ncbi:hypothetical protein NKJ26_07080 [Mesorhizobium sp. M0152]|uniref:hypothetical protein n=1 Tax=Mesorhizobium sp. M0152 TaxID=2956898 RepID=UPI00333BE717
MRDQSMIALGWLSTSCGSTQTTAAALEPFAVLLPAKRISVLSKAQTPANMAVAA